jgi:hypothetical protein
VRKCIKIPPSSSKEGSPLLWAALPSCGSTALMAGPTKVKADNSFDLNDRMVNGRYAGEPPVSCSCTARTC